MGLQAPFEERCVVPRPLRGTPASNETRRARIRAWTRPCHLTPAPRPRKRSEECEQRYEWQQAKVILVESHEFWMISPLGSGQRAGSAVAHSALRASVFRVKVGRRVRK